MGSLEAFAKAKSSIGMYKKYAMTQECANTVIALEFEQVS